VISFAAFSDRSSGPDEGIKQLLHSASPSANKYNVINQTNIRVNSSHVNIYSL
jgi:hypothetical protein